LSLNESEGDVISSAELGQPNDQFNWINIMGDQNEFGGFVFNQGGDVVQSEFNVHGFFGIGFLSVSFVLSFGL